MGRSVGTDIVPIKYGGDADWARSCSFYPSELKDEHAVREYDFLETFEPGGVLFKPGDFAEHGLDDEDEDDRFEAVTASTFLYQLAPEKRERARELFRKYLTKQGVIIYQDFVSDSSNPHELEIEEDWTKPYSYRTMIEFASDDSGRLYEMLRWNNGRCEQWRPGEDIKEILENNSNLQNTTFRTQCD
jgi:hypothetical protein